MTSSNVTSRKSHTYTWVAIVSALVTVSLLGLLLWKVNELEAEFGTIRVDRARIEAALESDRTELERVAASEMISEQRLPP